MNWQNASLAMAGLIGGGTAVIHGVLTQRLMVRPIEALMASDRRISAPVRRLMPLLLHFSTIAWLARRPCPDRRGRAGSGRRRGSPPASASAAFISSARSAICGARAVAIPAGC